jgi:hypothetical protein
MKHPWHRRKRTADPRPHLRVLPLMKSVLGSTLALLVLCTAAAPAAAQQVQGEVRDADRDRPLPGARLLLLDDDGVPVDSARTDAAGRYRLRAPAAGPYTVYFRVDGYAGVPSDPLPLAAGTTTEFVFRVPLVSVAAVRQMADVIGMEQRLQESLPELCGEPFRAWEAGLLVGVVRSRATRQPIPGARVVAVSADGDVARSTISSENGVYVLCNLPVGPAVVIRIEAPDGTMETTDVEVRAGSASWYDLPVGPRRR